MAEREDPLVGFKFGLEIEGHLSGYFSSVSGIGSESEIVDTKVVDDATGEDLMLRQPGRLTWTPVTLKRGVTSSLEIWEWRQLVVDGKIDEARANCSIIAYDQASTEVARWNFENAWPSKTTGPDMDAGSSDFAVEEVTIVHEGMYRET